MWRKLLARVHPDAGGSEDLFVWVMDLRDGICAVEEVARVPYKESGAAADFGKITARALGMVGKVEDVHARLLSELADCRTVPQADREARRGVSYKKLAVIAYAVGMTPEQRVRWYRVAESIPLSERHASHILVRLGKK